MVNLMAGVILAAGSVNVWGDDPTTLPEIEIVPSTAVSGPRLSAADSPSAPAPAVGSPTVSATTSPSPEPGTTSAMPTVQPTGGNLPNQKPKIKNPKAESKPATQPRTYKFSFKDAPIKDVLEVVAAWKGKPLTGLVGDDAPGGTLTYTNNQTFTADEAVVELNTILEKKGVYVAETEKELMVMRPTDIYRQFANVPVYMSYREFADAKLPDSTMAIVFHRFENAEVQDLEDNFRQFLPDSAMLTTQERSNRIILGTNARNIRKWFDLVQQLEQRADPREVRETVLYPLKHLSAQTAQMIVQQTVVPGLLVPRAPKPGQPPQPGLRVSNRVDLSRDDRNNVLVAVAAKDVQAQIKNLLDKLDVDGDANMKLQAYPLQHVTADEMYALLMPALYNEDVASAPGRAPKRQPGMMPNNRVKPNIIVDSRSNSLLVRAGEDEQKRIEAFIKDWDKASEAGDIHYYPLNVARAAEVVNQLRQLFPNISPEELVVSADDRSNTVLVRAAGERLQQIEEYVKRVDQGDAAPKEYPVVLKFAKPSDVAGALAPILSITVSRQKLISFQPNDPSGILVVLASEKDFKTRIEPLIQKLDVETGQARDLTTKKYDITKTDCRTLAQMMNQTFAGRIPTAKGDVPLTVNPDPHTNSLLVYSNAAGQVLAKAVIDEMDVDRPESAGILTRSFMLEGVDVNRLADNIRQQMQGRRRSDPGEIPGTVTSDSNTRQITITGSQRQMEAAEKMIQDAKAAVLSAKPATKTFDLKQANVDQVAGGVRELLNAQASIQGSQPPVVVTDAASNRLIISTTPDLLALADNVIRQMDTRQQLAEGRTLQVVHLTSANPVSVANTLQMAFGSADGKLRGLNVAVAPEPESGSLILSGQESDVAQVKKYLDELEISTKPTKPGITIYRMRTAYADEAAQTLGQLFTDPGKPVRFVPDTYAGILYISARQDQMAEIKSILDTIDPAKAIEAAARPDRTSIYYFPLKKAEAAKIAVTVQSLLAHEGTKNNPKVDGYALTNTLFVRCEPERLAEVEKVISQFDVATRPTRNIAIRTLPNGSAWELAMALQQAFAGAEQKVNVVPISNSNGIVIPQNTPATQPTEPATQPAQSMLPGVSHRFAAFMLAAGLGLEMEELEGEASPVESNLPSKTTGSSSAHTPSSIVSVTSTDEPISIAVDKATNLMFIRATETQLEEIDKMIDILLRTGLVSQQRLYTKKLKAADPQQVAQLLNQVYGSIARRAGGPGPQPPQQPGRRGQPQPQPQDGQAQVIAAEAIPFNAVGDKRTGYLFFRCDPKEEPSVMRLIADLDQIPPASKEVKWEIVPLKNIDAVEARDTVMVSLGLKQPPDAQIQGGDANQRLNLEIQKMMLRNNMIGRGMDVPDENLSPSDITVSANASTNSIVLQGPKTLVEYTKKLLSDLDKQEPPPGPVMRNFKLENADPAVAAEVINTLMRTQQRPGRKNDPTAVPVTVAPDARGRQVLVTCLDKDVPAVEEIIKKLDVPPDTSAAMKQMAEFAPTIIQVKYVRARDLQDRIKDIVLQLVMQGTQGKDVLKSQVLSVVADDATNRLIITASPAMKKLVTEILLPQLDTKDSSPIERKLRWLKLEHAGADDVARQLRDLLLADRQRAGQPKDSDLMNTPSITADSSTNSVLVYSAPQQFEEIEKFVKSLDVEGLGGGDIHVIQIRRGRAVDLAPQVETLLNSMSRSGGGRTGAQQAMVRADENTNTLLITGGPRQVKVVEELVATLDKVRPQSDRNVYIIPTGTTDPATLQQILQQMINQNKQNQPASGGGTGGGGRRNPRGPRSMAPVHEEMGGGQELSGDVNRQALQWFADGQWRLYALADAGEDSQALSDLIEQIRPTPTPLPQVQAPQAVTPQTPDDNAVAAQMQMVTPTPTPVPETPTRSVETVSPVIASTPQPVEQPKSDIQNQKSDTPPARFDLADLVAAQQGVGQAVRSQKADLAFLSDDVQIFATPGGLVIQANPEDFKILKEVIAMLTSETGGQLALLPLAKLEASEAAGIVTRVFTGTGGMGGYAAPVVVPDSAGNNLIVRGTAGQIEQVKSLVSRLEQSDQKATPTMRIFRVHNAQASVISGLLQRVFPAQQGRAGPDAIPMSIVPDDRTGSILVTAAPQRLTILDNLIKQLDVEPMDALGIRAELMVIPVKNADVSVLVQVLQNMVRPFTGFVGGQPGGGGFGRQGGGQFGGMGGMSPDALTTIRRLKVAMPEKKLPDIDLEKPIRIFADTQTSAVYLASTPENLKVLAELVTLLDTVPLTPGVKVNIRVLEHADAVESARILTDFFTQGRKLGAKTGELVSGRLSLAKPNSLSGEALSKPISIVADSRINAVILSGQEDSLSLAKLVLDEMDKPGADKNVPLTLIPLRFADATRLALTLQKVLDQRARGQSVSSALQALEKIVVQADARSNTLIVSASKANLPLVQELVAKLDVAPPTDGQVKLYTLKYATASKVALKIKNLFAAGLNRTETITDNPEVKLMDKLAIESDDRTRTIVVSTSRQNLAIIDDLVKRLDTQDTAVFTDMDTRFYQLKTGDAAAMADRLKQYFNDKLKQMTAIRPDAELPFAVFADPRTNTLVVTTTKEVQNDVAQMVETLDGGKLDTQFKVFKLQYAAAQTLVTTLQRIFTNRQRRMGGTGAGAQGSFSIESDLASNSIVASMTASDMVELEGIIKVLDVKNDGVSRTEVYYVKNAKAAQIISVLQSMYNAQRGGTGGGAGGTPGQTGQGYTFAQGGTSNSIVVKAPAGELAGIAELIDRLDKSVVTTPSTFELKLVKLKNGDASTVVSTVREILGQTRSGTVQQRSGGGAGTDSPATPVKIIGPEGQVLQAIREDVLINPDLRLNAVIIQAPQTSAEMVEQLVKMLDQEAPPAQIKIFVLKNADATKMFETLTKLFNLDSSGRPKTTSTQGDQSAPGNRMFFSDAAAVAALTAMGGAPGTGKEQIAVTLDVRTNSIVATGTPGYLAVLDEIIRDLDKIKTLDRFTVVIPLKNAKAADVVKAVTDSNKQENQVYSQGAEAAKTSPEQLMERQVSITQMESTNAVIISCSPRRYEQVARLVAELDSPPPQVMIQTLLAEVTLDDNTELGMDWGFQNLTFTDNSMGTGKGSGNDLIIGTDLGAAGAPNSLGGFNITITGEDFSYLLRALQTDGRLEVLSRPQIMVSDNKTGTISVGDSVPFVTNVILGTGSQPPQSQVTYKDIGIILKVTPHINPEGWVNMEIAPEISAISQSQTVVISQGVNAQVFSKRAADTTVNVRDGETVVLGGLITTRDETLESGIPLIKDIPVVGLAARVTKVSKKKTELLIIMTPRVVRTAEDARRLSIEERDNTGLLENIRRSPLMQGLQVKNGAVKPPPATMPAELEPVQPTEQMRQDVIIAPGTTSQPADDSQPGPFEPPQSAPAVDDNWPRVPGKPAMP